MHEKTKRPPKQNRPRPILDGNLLRLFSLCALFFFVIYVMLTARKPSSWEWMGFESKEKNTPAIRTSGTSSSKTVSDEVVINPEDPLVGGVSSLLKQEETPQFDLSEDQEKFQIQLANLSQKLESVEDDFWRQVYDRFDNENRRDLFRLVRFIANETSADDTQLARFRKIVDYLIARRKTYETQLFQHIRSLPESQEQQKKSWSEVLFQAQSQWNNDYQPVLSRRLANKECDRPDAVKRLYQFIEKQSYRDVRDGSQVGRAKEGVAWLVMLQNILDEKKSGTVPPSVEVTQLELNSQPETYRGKSVRLSGFVRSARLQTTKNHELGIEKYYILWIKPEEQSTFPYCVYALDLPSGFPEVQRETVELNEKVEIIGRFFKVRSYKANGGWRECPLVIANTPRWFENESIADEAVVLPSWPVMIGTLVLMALAAAGLAYWVYRATSQPSTELVADEATVASDFAALKENPAVETVSDRLRKMSENS